MTVTLRDLANKQHGPSAATMSVADYDRQRTALAPTHCPECGSELTIDMEAMKGNVDSEELEPVCAAFCSGCEFVVEF